MEIVDYEATDWDTAYGKSKGWFDETHSTIAKEVMKLLIPASHAFYGLIKDEMVADPDKAIESLKSLSTEGAIHTLKSQLIVLGYAYMTSTVSLALTLHKTLPDVPLELCTMAAGNKSVISAVFSKLVIKNHLVTQLGDVALKLVESLPEPERSIRKAELERALKSELLDTDLDNVDPINED